MTQFVREEQEKNLITYLQATRVIHTEIAVEMLSGDDDLRSHYAAPNSPNIRNNLRTDSVHVLSIFLFNSFVSLNHGLL